MSGRNGNDRILSSTSDEYFRWHAEENNGSYACDKLAECHLLLAAGLQRATISMIASGTPHTILGLDLDLVMSRRIQMYTTPQQEMTDNSFIAWGLLFDLSGERPRDSKSGGCTPMPSHRWSDLTRWPSQSPLTRLAPCHKQYCVAVCGPSFLCKPLFIRLVFS